jgi:hypothetical protein
MNQTYIVVEYSGDLVAFVKEVNAKILLGYKPLGGITSSMFPGKLKPTYFQALVSKEEKPK